MYPYLPGYCVFVEGNVAEVTVGDIEEGKGGRREDVCGGVSWRAKDPGFQWTPFVFRVM